jgi:hypothetical protein
VCYREDYGQACSMFQVCRSSDAPFILTSFAELRWDKFPKKIMWHTLPCKLVEADLTAFWPVNILFPHPVVGYGKDKPWSISTLDANRGITLTKLAKCAKVPRRYNWGASLSLLACMVNHLTCHLPYCRYTSGILTTEIPGRPTGDVERTRGDNQELLPSGSIARVCGAGHVIRLQLSDESRGTFTIANFLRQTMESAVSRFVGTRRGLSGGFLLGTRTSRGVGGA